MKDKGKPTIDLLLATKAIIDRDLELGFITEKRLRFTIEARRKEASELAKSGASIRQIAKLTGVSKSATQRDIQCPTLGHVEEKNNNKNNNDVSQNGPSKLVGFRSSRELTGQSDQNDWRTPRKFLDAAREVMGVIDLDPASSAEANETVQAKTFYTEADDGLVQSWKGSVWLNPPYGGSAKMFIDRLVKEYQVGNVTSACALINAHCTETKWFQQLFDNPICFIAGRIDFGGPSREISSTSTHGSVIVYLGKRENEFVKAFSKFGSVVKKIEIT